MFGIALGLQARFLWRIHTGWESMTMSERWKVSVAGVVVPILAAVAGFFAIAIVLALLIVGVMLRMLGVKSVPRVGGFFSGVLKDAYGNRRGSVDPDTGEIKDAYGNRTGWVYRDSGETKDAYENRTGRVDRDNGELKDAYANRTASVDPGTGEIKDKYGNRIGSIE